MNELSPSWARNLSSGGGRAARRAMTEIHTQYQLGAYQATLDVRLAAHETNGLAALTGHMMQRVVELDEHRQALAGNDPVQNAMLGQLEQNFVRACSGIQTRLFNGFGF